MQPCSIASYLNPLQIQAKRRFGEQNSPGLRGKGSAPSPRVFISLRAGDKIREVWRQLLSPWLSVPVLLPPALLPKTPHTTSPLDGELEPCGCSFHRPCASCSSCCWWRGLENALRGFSSHGGRSRAPRGHLLALPAQPCKAKKKKLSFCSSPATGFGKLFLPGSALDFLPGDQHQAVPGPVPASHCLSQLLCALVAPGE